MEDEGRGGNGRSKKEIGKCKRAREEKGDKKQRGKLKCLTLRPSGSSEARHYIHRKRHPCWGLGYMYLEGLKQGFRGLGLDIGKTGHSNTLATYPDVHHVQPHQAVGCAHYVR